MMSSETVSTNVEVIRQKLKKYTHLKEHRKVKEYLRRLRNLSLTLSLIQETKLDRLVRKLASNKTASYSSTARHLLQKWHHKKLLLPRSKPIESMPQNQSDEHNFNTSIEINQESQSFDDNKKRKVLSLAEYLQNKKPALSSSLTLNSTQNQLTDVQIQVINAQFQATTAKLTANACDLATIVNKTLIQTEKSLHDPHHLILKKINSQESNSQMNDLWAEEEDDDDEDEDDPINQSPLSQSRTVNNNFHTQKVQ